MTSTIKTNYVGKLMIKSLEPNSAVLKVIQANDQGHLLKVIQGNDRAFSKQMIK